MSSIGRRFDRGSSSIFPHLALTGGLRPPTRSRSRFAPSLIEREEISRGLAAQHSFRSIARALSRSPSTVSRAGHRNGGRHSYRAALSDQRAWDCARRPKSRKLSFDPPLQPALATRPCNPPLCHWISRTLRLKWSPEQIAGWLKRKHPDEEPDRVSHETIDRSLYVQTGGVLKKELQACLRSPRAIRRSRQATRKGLKLCKIKNAVPISERPPEAEDRAVPGHWPLGDASITCRLTGGRFDCWIEQQLHRHADRAAVPFCDACEGPEQGHPERHERADQAGAKAAQRAL